MAMAVALKCEDCGADGVFDDRLPSSFFDGCKIVCRGCMEQFIRKEHGTQVRHQQQPGEKHGWMPLAFAEDGRPVKWFR